MKLQLIADEMKRYATNNPYSAGADLSPYRRELPRGLTLTYIDAGKKRLAITRRNVAPSEFEETICRRAFDVPAEVDRAETAKGDCYHVTYTWPVAPVKLSETTEPEPFVAGATYTLAGAVYRAHKVGSLWLLADLNKSFSYKAAVGVFCGYAVKNGRPYHCEYAWRNGHRRWQTAPEPANTQVSDFVRCEIVTKTIKFNGGRSNQKCTQEEREPAISKSSTNSPPTPLTLKLTWGAEA